MIEKEKITENKVIIENGEFKTIFNEIVENNGGWMDIEEARRLTIEGLNKLEKEMMNGNNTKKSL